MVIYIKFQIAKETDAFYPLLIRIHCISGAEIDKKKNKWIFAKNYS